MAFCCICQKNRSTERYSSAAPIRAAGKRVRRNWGDERYFLKVNMKRSCVCLERQQLRSIKRSDWNKKGRLERKRLFRSAMIIFGSAEGRFQKAYGLALPN